MAGCCGNSSVAASIIAARNSTRGVPVNNGDDRPITTPPKATNGMLRVRWLGSNKGSVQLRMVGGVALSQTYKFSKGLWEFADCPPKDAELLVRGGKCEYVAPPATDIAATAVLPTPETRLTPPTVAQVFPAPVRVVAPPIFQEEPDSADTPDTPDEPVEAQGETAPFDIGAATVSQVREYAVMLGADELRGLLEQETAGKNRATLVALLERAIKDAERVG